MRVSQEIAYVLHTRDYGETSLLVELFTRNHGRIGAVAKGARTKKSRHGAILSPFQSILVGWSGKGELVTLTASELINDCEILSGEPLFCGLYINELLILMLHRFDEHKKLFDVYADVLQKLNQGQSEHNLRMFEKIMLTELGYGLVLDHDIADNRPVDPDVDYLYIADKGPVRAYSNQHHGVIVSGRSLVALAQEKPGDEKMRAEIKRLMRNVISYHLDGRPLHSRQLIKSLRTKQQGLPQRDRLND